MEQENKAPIQFSSQLVLGIILMLAGGLALLDNVGMIEVGSIWKFWPLLVIGLGVSKIVQAESPRQRRKGVWLTFVGLWLFVSVFQVYGLTFHTSWPLLIVGWGVGMIWKAAEQEANVYV